MTRTFTHVNLAIALTLILALVVRKSTAAASSAPSSRNAIEQYNFLNGCSYRTVDAAMKPIGVTTATNYLNNTIQDWNFGAFTVLTGQECRGRTSPIFTSVACQTEHPRVGAHNITTDLEYKKLDEKRVLVHTYTEEHINDSSRPDLSEFSYAQTLTTTHQASVTKTSELGITFGVEVSAFFATSSFQTSFSMSSSNTQTKTGEISYEVGLRKQIEMAPNACTRLSYQVHETYQKWGWHSPVVAQGVWIDGWKSGSGNALAAGYMVDGHGFYERTLPNGRRQYCFGKLEPTELDVVVGQIGGAAGWSSTLVKREFPLKRDANGNPVCDDSKGVTRTVIEFSDQEIPSPRNLGAKAIF